MQHLLLCSVVIAAVSAPAIAAQATPSPDVNQIVAIATNAATSEDARMLAKVIYTEARGLKSPMEQAAVAWCVLNRVDSSIYPNSVKGVVTQQHQFAWKPGAPVDQDLLEISTDVLIRWQMEKLGYGDVGRVLPPEYMYFTGNGQRNRFTARGTGKVWNWDCENPYSAEIVITPLE